MVIDNSKIYKYYMMNHEGILFQFAFGELINSYMALFLAGRRVEAKDEQD